MVGSYFIDWQLGQGLPEEFFEVYDHVRYEYKTGAPKESKKLIRTLFSKQHSFHESSQCWVAWVSGKSRLCGFYTPGALIDGKKAAYFGLWETVDDQSSNEILFKALRDWAKSKGAEILVGPITFNTFLPYRLGDPISSDHDLIYGEPVTPPHYHSLMKSLKFRPLESYETIILKRSDQLLDYLSASLNKLSNDRFHFAVFNHQEWSQKYSLLYDIVHEIFAQNKGFISIPRSDFKLYMKQTIGKKIDPRLSSIIYDRFTGEAAGFCLCYPNYGPLLDSRTSSSITVEDLDYHKHHSMLEDKYFVGKTVGVKPNFQGHKLFALMAVRQFYRAIDRYGYSGLMLPNMRKGNPSLTAIPPVKHQRRKSYLFGCEIN